MYAQEVLNKLGAHLARRTARQPPWCLSR